MSGARVIFALEILFVVFAVAAKIPCSPTGTLRLVNGKEYNMPSYFATRSTRIIAGLLPLSVANAIVDPEGLQLHTAVVAPNTTNFGLGQIWIVEYSNSSDLGPYQEIVLGVMAQPTKQLAYLRPPSGPFAGFYFCEELWLDHPDPIVGGREMTFPKHRGQLSVTQHGSSESVILRTPSGTKLAITIDLSLQGPSLPSSSSFAYLVTPMAVHVPIDLTIESVETFGWKSSTSKITVAPSAKPTPAETRLADFVKNFTPLGSTNAIGYQFCLDYPLEYGM